MGRPTIIPLAADVFGGPVPAVDLRHDATGRTAQAARPVHHDVETVT